MLYAQIEALILGLKADIANAVVHLRRIIIFIGFLLMILVALGSAAEVWSLKAQISEQARVLGQMDYSIRRIENIMALNAVQADGDHNEYSHVPGYQARPWH
ncbi:MAG: hypothetical protein IKO41_21490 [Lachnospiraceae bacterium]|nr:hypothetical protein [Lachnospiraceae bacterium]